MSDTNGLGRRTIITTPARHRALLLLSMEAVAEGKMNVSQANAIACLSGEVHKSIRQEWDMRTYAEEKLGMVPPGLVGMLEAGGEEDLAEAA